MEKYMTVRAMFNDYCKNYSVEEKERVIDIYGNSGPKQRELIKDKMIGYIMGTGDWFPYDYDDFVLEYGGMGDYPAYQFAHMIMRGDLFTETDFRELEESLLETHGADHLEIMRADPKWCFDVLDDVKDTKLFGGRGQYEG